MRPGQQPRLLGGGQRLLESVDGLIRVAGQDGRPGQDEVGAGALGRRFQGIGMDRQHLPRHGAGRSHVSGREPRLGQVQARQFARPAAPQHLAVGLLVELSLPGAMHLLVRVHAVHHLADGVAQTGRIFFKLDQLLEEVLREHKSLGHVVAHCGPADDVHLLLVNLSLMLITRQLRPVRARGNLVRRNPGVHGPRLDRFDEALDGQRHGVGAVTVLHRSFPHLLQYRLHPVYGIGPRINQRLDHIVQVGMAHVVHANLPVYRRNHHYVVGPIDAGIHRVRRE